MLLCEKIDLDLEEPSEVYKNAEETVKYLTDIMTSLENRVLKGEKIKGFTVVEGSKKRVITDFGFSYLEKVLGREEVYKKVEKPIGVTDIDKLFDKEEVIELFNKGVLAYEPGKPKIVIKGE